MYSPVGVEHEQRPRGAQAAHLAVVPQPRRRVAGRRDAQGGGLGVEHHDADGDELLGALEGRHLAVELLEGLRRVAELPEEHPQQVLGLERGDRRLDAVAGDVADHRRDARGRDPEHVVEVAGHEPGAGLVHAAQLEAGEVGQVLGGQAGGPAAGCQLLLGEHLLGPALQHDAVLGEAGLAAEVLPEEHRQADRDQDEGEEVVRPPGSPRRR